MAKDSRLEYVRFNYHSDTVDNLKHSTELLQNSINNASQASELQMQKHDKIADAKDKVALILEELERLNELLFREEYMATMRTKTPRSVVYREAAAVPGRKTPREEKDVLVRSEKALQNLQRNLEILKRQLK